MHRSLLLHIHVYNLKGELGFFLMLESSSSQMVWWYDMDCVCSYQCEYIKPHSNEMKQKEMKGGKDAEALQIAEDHMHIESDSMLHKYRIIISRTLCVFSL